MMDHPSGYSMMFTVIFTTQKISSEAIGYIIEILFILQPLVDERKFYKPLDLHQKIFKDEVMIDGENNSFGWSPICSKQPV